MKVKGVLRMHSTAKTIGDKKSGNSCSSKLVAEVQFKKRSNSSLTIFGTPKCSVKKLGSSALKRKVEASSSKRTGNNIAHKDGSSDAAACDRKSLKKLRDKDVAFDWPERNEANASGHVKRRRCKSKRRQKGQTELDQACRLQRRTRYLMIKMKLEQNLIDAYSGEGWKGQSREKIKPEKELLRAKKQILKCKLGIRDVFHQLDLLSSVGSIEGSVIAPDGSVYHEHIFCAKCKSRDAFPDNDIVLCDGTCNCAFHQKCLEPPLETENLPPEDQGWFCKFCECKMEIVEAMNAHIGTQFSVDSKWQDIFKEEAAFPDGAPSSNLETEWPSDDSEDDDYDPKRGGNSCSDCGGSDACALDDSTCSTSLSWSLHDSPEISGEEIIGGRRKRQAVDYKKLYEEMFGKDALPHEPVSEDEDWGPNKVKCREKESDAISCLMTLGESETKCQNDESREVERKLVSVLKSKTSCRIPLTAVEKLRQVFAENELPSRGTKAKLSDELGLEPEKVNKWFKNARYLAIKSRKAECREQFDISAHRVFDDSDQRAAKSKTVVALTSENALEGNELGGTHMKRKRNPKLSQECAEKYIEASSSSATKSCKARKEAGDDVILKELLKRRENKKVDGGRLQEFEGVMEKICAAKIRLENVKKRLLRLANGKARKFNGCHFQSVTYVPIVEVEEKNRSC